MKLSISETKERKEQRYAEIREKAKQIRQAKDADVHRTWQLREHQRQIKSGPQGRMSPESFVKSQEQFRKKLADAEAKRKQQEDEAKKKQQQEDEKKKQAEPPRQVEPEIPKNQVIVSPEPSKIEEPKKTEPQQPQPQKLPDKPIAKTTETPGGVTPSEATIHERLDDLESKVSAQSKKVNAALFDHWLGDTIPVGTDTSVFTYDSTNGMHWEINDTMYKVIQRGPDGTIIADWVRAHA